MAAWTASLGLELAGDLLDLDDDELRRLERREPDDDVHDPAIDVRLRRRLLVAFDEIGVAGGRSLERTLAEEAVHEHADVEADLRPQGLVIRFEDDPFDALEEALFDKQRGPSDRDVLPLTRLLVGAVERSG